MSSDEHPSFLLSPAAFVDLDDIWRFTAEKWSLDQADTYVDELVEVFSVIGRLPTIAREHAEFTPPVRIHVHGSHLIGYVAREDYAGIVRVLGARQAWVSVLRNAEL